MSRQMSDADSVESFAAAILESCMQLNIGSGERLTYFLRGLKPEIKQHVLRSAPSNFDEAVISAKLFESTQNLQPPTPSGWVSAHNLGHRAAPVAR